MKKFLFIAVVIVVLLFIVDRTILKDKGVAEQTTETYKKVEDLSSLEVGVEPQQLAPSFELNTLSGERVSLEDLRGKRIMVNFWATWCPPCKAEMPDMQTVYETYGDEDIVILGVNVTPSEKNPELVSDFVEEYQLTFPILMDEVGEVTYRYEILSYPTSYFIDSDGVIRKKVIGPLSKEAIEREFSLLP